MRRSHAPRKSYHKRHHAAIQNEAFTLHKVLYKAQHMLKQNLRQQMRFLRFSLALEERATAADQVQQRLQELCRAQNWKAFAVYLATDEELNLDDFIAWLLARGIVVYAPRGDNFALLSALEAVNLGNFGVREPLEVSQSELVADNLVFLVPGLAFDRRGGRLGFGGGWYDRALARFPQVPKIGVAFDFQIVDEVPREAHDISMDAIVTPHSALQIPHSK